MMIESEHTRDEILAAGRGQADAGASAGEFCPDCRGYGIRNASPCRRCNGTGRLPLPLGRDELGRKVREAWVRWAKTQPNPKPGWLIPYDDLPEVDKEADRQIGEAVARWTLIADAARRGSPVNASEAAVVERCMKRATEVETYGSSNHGCTVEVYFPARAPEADEFADFLRALLPEKKEGADDVLHGSLAALRSCSGGD